MDDIHLIKNIFTEEERKRIIQNLQPLLTTLYNCPGRQTWPTIHLHETMSPFITRLLNLTQEKLGLNLEIQRAWAKWSNGKKDQMNWHKHDSDIASVYYLKTNSFLNSGTLFKDRGFVRASPNDFIIFPGNFEHSTPSHPFGIERYVVSVNFMVK